MFSTKTNFSGIRIRPLEARDNEQLLQVIKATFTEFDVKFSESPDQKKQLEDMFGFYNNPANHGGYFVLSDDAGTIYGGGGFSRLRESKQADKICELEKFYFSPTLRAQSWGRELLYRVAMEAIKKDYKIGYIESSPVFKAAAKLRKSFGFVDCKPQGNTGKQQFLTIFMQLELNKDKLMELYNKMDLGLKNRLAKNDDTVAHTPDPRSKL